MPGGRPTKYRQEMCQTVRELGDKGYSLAQMARDLDVALSAFNRWRDQHPEFGEAVKDAQERSQAWWEDAGMRGLFADKFNATAFIFQMKNRFRDSYRDKIDHDHKGDVTFTVATGVPERPNQREETHDDDEDDGEVD